MSDGKNILELVLNQKIAERFRDIDAGIVSMQKNLDLATDSAGKFLAKMQELSQIFNVSGAGDFAANIDKLVQSMNSLNAAGSNTSGLVKQNEATQQIGQSAVQSVDDVNRLIEAINKLPEALNKSKQGAGGGGEKKSILDSLLFDTSGLEQKRKEFSELIRGLELQLSSASQRMRSGSDMNVANSSIYRFYDELANRCRERIENITKGISLNGVMDSWQQQGIFDKIEQGQTTYQKELQKAIADEETLSKILLDIEKEYETLTQKADSYRKAADLGKGMEEQSRTEYTAILQQLAEVRAKYQAVSDEIQKVIDTNKKMEQSSKELEGYKKRLEEMAVAWERMKLTGTAYDKNGRMTAEAQQLMEDKKALEEKIRLYQMSADEAIKQEQRKRAEIEKSEKDTASEIKRLLDERLKLLHQIREAETKRDTTQSGTELYRLLNVQIEEYKKRLAEVTEATKNVAKGNESIAAEAAKAYSTKRAEQRVKEEEKYQNAIDKTIKELQRLKEERDKANQKQARESIGLEGGQAPKTIEQYRIAIQNLKREIGKLDTETQKSKINEYNQKIRQYENEIKKATGATEKFRNENKRLKNVMQQVAGAFGLYISFQSLINFGKNVAQITGEFELQHRAMQAIIGDMDKANRLWDKTVRLAVKSPYSVKELVTYTKQLAAYRIETEKLYDTTKMLADISSGLGVDMQRLILAYGQVKAANYLRGQELRQFSEAGVNILGELANYFTELQGKAISTGDVFEMVSKRMVKFEDVSEVLHRLTEEGGIFFNMQEIQAETLKGMFMNLKDSFDLMKNEIGESNKGFFVSLVNTAKYVADNWNTVGNTLKWVTGIVIGLRVAIKAGQIQLAATTAITNGATIQTTLLTKILALFNKQVRKATGGTVMFGNALKGLGAAGWAGGLLGGLMAVFGIVSAIVGHYRKLNEEQAKLERISNESAANMTKSVAQYRELAIKIKDVNTSESERAELMAKMKRLYGDILPERLRNIEYITKEGNAYEEAIVSIKAYYQALRQERIIDATVSEYEDRIQKRQENTAKEIQKQIKKTYDLEVSITSINAAINQLRSEMDAGSVSAENFTERFQELLQIQTGAPIDFKAFNEFIQSYGVVNTLVSPMEPLVRLFQEITDKIAQLTGRSEDFTKTMQDALNMDVFAKGLENLNKQLDDDVANGLAGEGFENALKYRAEKAEEFFKNQFDDFKKSDFYKSLNDAQKKAIQDQFEVQLKIKVDEQALKNSKVTIASKIDELINQFNLDDSQVGLVQKYLMGDTESNSEYYKRVKEDLETQLSNIKDIENGVYNGTKEENERLLSMKPAFEMWLAFIEMLWGKTKSTSSGNKNLNILNKQIDAIKNAAKQYDEYKKMYDDTSAYEKTKTEVEGLFRELNIGHILDQSGAFDENVIKDNLNVWLAKSIAAAGKGGQQVAEKYISGLQLAFDKEDYSKTVIEPFKKAMEDAIDAISMGDELEKLGIGRDFGKIIFGIDTTTTKQMKEQVEKWKQDLTAIGTFGDEAEKEYKNMIEKIDDMEDKAQKERLKKYIGYMQQAMSERAKIQVQGLAELAEIERTFQEEIAKAYKVGDTARVQYLQEIQKAAIEGTKKATDEKLQKQTWEDFKKSTMYTELFSDIENISTKSLTAMREKLTEMQGTLNNLDPQNLKAIAEEIDKLEDAIVKRNPFKSLVDYWMQWQDIQSKGYTEESIVTDLSKKTKNVGEYTDELAGLEKQLYNLQHVQIDDIGAIDVQSDAYKLQLEMLQKQIQEKKNDINATEKEIMELEKMYAILQKLRNAENTFESEWKKMMNTVKSASDSIIDGLSAFGVETDNTTEAFGTLLDSIIDIIAVLPTYIAGMNAAGVAINSAMGIIGLIAEVITLVIGLVKAIAGMRDAQITDTIDGYKDKVDALSDSYDRLEKAYDKAWDVQDLVRYREQLQKNIDQQIKYYEAMIKAEESRKDPDESQILKWKNTINDLFDEKDEAQSKFLEESGGITDFKSAAQEFVDAWAEAFMETGDGLEALQETFDEYLKNLVKKQAMERVAKHYLEDIFDMINNAIGDDGLVSVADMDKVREKFDSIAPQFSSAMQAIFESLGIFGDQASGELTGLQKGIQGVTEDTAEIIAAYLNAMRLIVIENGSKLSQIINIIQDTSGLYNPMLVELRNIKNRADDIYYFLNQRRENGTDSLRVYVVNA